MSTYVPRNSQPGFNGEENLLEASIKELQRQLTPVEIKKRITQEEAAARIGLGAFVETTSDLILEPWQNHMCRRLEKLTYQTGQRILMHKPPQHGGSVIVSQRLPAYLIGTDPTRRVRLACYNIDHATKFCGINKNIMTSGEYKALFPDDGLYVKPRQSDEEFYTVARHRVRDAQASLKALGLATGFVGQGADDLIVDDPYPSPQAADSPAIRASTWLFWTGSARVRIDSNTNVVFMFHRYNEEDIVGQLIAEEGLKSKGGVWELISYRAQWDSDERLEVGGEDPLKRAEGEYLSPRKAAQEGYYDDQKKNPKMWQSQFQGKPSNAEGSFFLVRNFIIIPKCPVQLQKVVLSWDTASSKDGDWTVGVLMGLGVDELVYVLDVTRVRETTDERNKTMLLTATLHRRKYPDLIVRVPQDPAGAGKDQAVSFTKLFKGFELKIEGVRGDKEVRADPWSGYVNAGLVRLVSNAIGSITDWVNDYVQEHRKFPNSVKKDQIDASSDGFAELALSIDEEPGEEFDTIGLAGGDSALDPSKELALEEQEMIAELLGFEGYEEAKYGNTNYEQEETAGTSKTSEIGDSKYSTIRERQSIRQIKTRGILSKRSNKH